MDSVIRAAAVYIILLLIFRISGRRSLAQITTFDFVLLLIVSEAIQQAMLGEDSSITHAVLLVVTLMSIDIGLSLLKKKVPASEKIFDGLPSIILENGKPLKDRLRKARVDEDDILAAAREKQGLERLDQIQYAVIEQSGGISIVPKKEYR